MNIYYLIPLLSITFIFFKLNQTKFKNINTSIQLYLTKESKVRNDLIHEKKRNYGNKIKNYDINNYIQKKYHIFIINYKKKIIKYS